MRYVDIVVKFEYSALQYIGTFYKLCLQYTDNHNIYVLLQHLRALYKFGNGFLLDNSVRRGK